MVVMQHAYFGDNYACDDGDDSMLMVMMIMMMTMMAMMIILMVMSTERQGNVLPHFQPLRR